MDHRAISLSFIQATGLIPVKVFPNQKDPFPDWDPRRATLFPILETIERIRVEELNIGALFSGKWVDLDVDTKDPALLAALEHFMPRTRYIWGRASKPKSHWAYQLTADFDRTAFSHLFRFMKALKIEDTQYSLELRGGTVENGLFSVMPGSTHPSGEYVKWESEFDPTVSNTVVSVHALTKGMRMAQAAALVSRFWVEGVRNDICLAFAGVMWRIRASSMALLNIDEEDEAPENVFLLTEADAVRLLTAVMTIAGDDPEDQRSRLINMENTWRKLDNDSSAKVTGGKVLAEFMGEPGEKVVKALYRLLSDNDGIDQLDDLCEQFVMWYGQGVLIDKKMVEVGLPVPWMNKEQAGNSLAGKRVKIGDKKINIVSILFGSAIIPRVYGITFDPSSNDRIVPTVQGSMVNQWRGFDCEPCPQKVTPDEIEPFLNYVREVLANGNQKAHDWILDWCADMLQFPGDKPGTSLVLVGVQGAGKTFLGEHILGRIIGDSHYVQINSIENLTNKFNQLTDNKVFTQCDEAVHSYQKDIASRLKSIITDKTMTVEPKGVNAFKKPNHMRILFTSNDEQAAIFIDPTPHERRFTVQKVSDSRAGDLEYWTMMHEWVPNNIQKVMRWLLDRKYNKKDILRPLDTHAKRVIQRVGVDPEISWIINRVLIGFPLAVEQHRHWFNAFEPKAVTENDIRRDVLRRDIWPSLVQLGSIEEDFRAYIRKHGKPVYSGSVITNIKRALPPESVMLHGQRNVEVIDQRHGQMTKERIRLYTWPTQEQILDHLKMRLGSMIDTLIEDHKKELEEVMPDFKKTAEEY